MKWILGFLWFGVSIYAGYLLTAQSFAFLNEPNILQERLPEQGEDAETWFESLSEEEQACIRASVSPARLEAALAGEELEPTTEETIRVGACLRQ